MHLASVTLRGFKSFADRTTLRLDPGLVAVVGPNGTGKSNLVDALIWSLGSLSTRALRAERMEDVIFVGTNERKALGMAQVVLTFDNASGTFPLDFTEVQIGRTLYRDGASEYSLNGTVCRLLDVQELLAEAGIGRELHAVVAQGQVDEIAQSRPEDLRSHIEEAAGISKHRRRKERAIRKIESVEADISRAADLTGELRRQIRPLRAQAEQALRHREITDHLREVRIRLLVGELEDLHRERRRSLDTREGATQQLEDLRGDLERLRASRSVAEERLDTSRHQASGIRRGLEHLRSAQASALRAVVYLRERAHARPDERRREALEQKRTALDAEETEVRSALDETSRTIGEQEGGVAALRDERRRFQEEVTAATERLAQIREELTRIEVEAQGAEQTQATARAEAHTATERHDRAAERLARLEDTEQTVVQEIERLDAEAGRASLTVDRLDGERQQAQTAFEEAEGKLRHIEAEDAVLKGRLESLRVARDLTASRRQGAEGLRAAHGVEIGARGILGDVVRVPSGLEAAFEAVFGGALDALVVAGARLADAVDRAEREQRDVVVVPTIAADRSTEPLAGARPLTELIEAPGWLRGTIDALLERAYLADRPEDAARLAAEHPDTTFVTPEGRVLRGRGISRPARSGGNATLGIVAALERTEEACRKLDSERGRWTTNRDRHRHELTRLDSELEEARSTLHEVEGRIAAAADRLRELKAEARGATLERDLGARERDERLRRAEGAAAKREELGVRAGGLRTEEEEASARLKAAEDRLTELEGEARGAEDALSELLQHKASLSERLRGIERAREELRAEQIEADVPPPDPEALEAAETMLSRLDAFVARAEAQARDLLRAEETVEDELHRLSQETSKLEVHIASLEPRTLHAAESLARIDAHMEEIGSRLAREFDIPPSRAREEFPLAGDPEELRATEHRLAAELSRMGPVNPLAADEVVALEERREFLEAQLEDLRSSKRDLVKLVRAAEEEMRQLLQTATADTDERFREVIGLLFPEGDGRLRLTGSDDPLEAGLEIEVRLGRKGHRRLAFLSGGEKALVGLGFLFALHLARPTPFLVLDEVDAPLDDANLGRFLRLLDSLRTRTQVLVITHQKRTMERADKLIGVTLNPDGTSRVIIENLRERSETPA